MKNHCSLHSAILLMALCCTEGFNRSPPSTGARASSFALRAEQHELSSSRRDFFQKVAKGAFGTLAVLQQTPRPAQAASGITDLSSDLPPDAARSYLQYRVNLQVAADYYVYELQEMVSDPEQWGEVTQLFATSNSRGGQGQPNRVERDFINPMRILGLSMPPDIADALRDSQFAFERSMQQLTKATSGYQRNLSVELDPKSIQDAKQGWESGRKALNSFFVAVNDAVGLEELQSIPPAGPKQSEEYGRSQRKFLDLMKKTKLCQNRGGPALSQAWGQLMVSGYLQDSCGIPDMEGYFYQ
mmetsp:Transcript_54028/g.80615  ORF Transcript_54028/g.80615 Transcript_54028/m.80615 type:complete len:300 (-) Transcript_54028:92-991(-)